MFRFHGSRKLFAVRRQWRTVGPNWSGAAEAPGCCRHGDVTHPSESYTDLCCFLRCLPAPLGRHLFIRQLLLLLHAQGGFFHTCALLLQVCMSSHVELHQENTACSYCVFDSLFTLTHSVIHVFACRTDCESPASFLCSYPMANISLMRNKKHVCMNACVCIYLCIYCMYVSLPVY